MADVSPQERERRYANVRAALDEAGLDAVIVCGSEYTGFEGAVTYMSGFQIVHRYAYVLLPREGDPAIVFPSEARYVGEHGTTWIEEQVFADQPGSWLAERLAGRRVGVYGRDYVMTVRAGRAPAKAIPEQGGADAHSDRRPRPEARQPRARSAALPYPAG